MNEHQLSKRLAAVACFVPLGTRLADIGSDHAYLPAFLILQGKLSSAIAGELNSGPLQRAQELVDQLGLGSVIDVRQGDGLEVVKPGEVDVVCIAGMGGALICQILENGKAQLDKVQRLILQPNVAGHLIRQWLIDHDWQLVDESLVEEDDKYYEILVAEPGNPLQPYSFIKGTDRERQILMGPFLLEKTSNEFIEKWKREIEKRERVLASLQHSQGEEIRRKRCQLLTEVEMIRGGIEA